MIIVFETGQKREFHAEIIVRKPEQPAWPDIGFLTVDKDASEQL